MVQFSPYHQETMIKALRKVKTLVIIPPNRTDRVEKVKAIVSAAQLSSTPRIVMISFLTGLT